MEVVPTAEQFDLVVIGGGPGGYGSALYAASAGLSVAIVEKDVLGGTCLNRGCIPAKAFLETAAVHRHVAHAKDFGIEAGSPSVHFDVTQALYTYLNPLVGGAMDGSGAGWEFGRALNQGELYGVIHQVEGVDFVKILRVYETDLKSGEQQPKQAGSHIPLEPDELIASGRHLVRAEHQEL